MQTSILFRQRHHSARLHASACLRTTPVAPLLQVLMCDCQPLSHVPVTCVRYGLSWTDLAGTG